MFLDDLLEAGIVELGELCEIVHVGNDITEVLLEQQIILLAGQILKVRLLLLLDGAGVVRLGAFDHVLHLAFGGADAADDILALDMLEGKDLVQLLLELANESLLVLLGPGLARGLRVRAGGLGLVLGLEAGLEIIVGDVGVLVVSDQRCFELVAEPAMGGL